MAIIKETINQKALELLQRSLWLWTIREYSLSVSSGTSEYYLPADFDKILDIRQTNSPAQLSRLSVFDFDNMQPSPTATGNPLHYMLLLQERVWAQPTAAAKVVMYSTSNQDIAAEDGAAYVTLKGVVGGVERIEQVTLSATNEISSTNSYAKLFDISADDLPAGSLYFRELTVGTELLALYPNEISKTFNKIRFHPIPDKSATMYIKYQATQPRLINDSDSLIIPDKYSNILVEMVVGDMLLKQGDSKGGARIQLAEAGIDRMKKEQDMMWDYVPTVKSAPSHFLDNSYPFSY